MNSFSRKLDCLRTFLERLSEGRTGSTKTPRAEAAPRRSRAQNLALFLNGPLSPSGRRPVEG